MDNMEEIKKKAVEKLRNDMKQDYEKGYKRACQMLANGELSLQEAQQLVDAEEPLHDALAGESKDYVKGFIAGLDEVLEEAKRQSSEE
jgi:hypothetical protein